MPHEHEMPAPVTTMIFLHFATDREMSVRALRVLDSATGAPKSSVTVISDAIGYKETRNQGERELPRFHDVCYCIQVNRPSCLKLFGPCRDASITCVVPLTIKFQPEIQLWVFKSANLYSRRL